MSNNHDHSQEALSRRDLLKKIGAAGAILGARAIVPTNWAKPAAESGLLPVHAQTSGFSTVNGEVWLDQGQQKPSAPATLGPSFSVTVKGFPLLTTDTSTATFDNGIYKCPFSIPNVPIGSRTLVAHEITNWSCGPDIEAPVTVVPGITNAGHIDFTWCD